MKKILAAMLILAAFFICGCGEQNSFERTENLMGTAVTLKATGKNSKVAVDESFEKIFELVEKVKVDIKNLNDNAGNGKFIKISPEVFEMLEMSQKYSALTDGAFDVTVGAAVDLWKVARKNKILPAETEIETVKNFVGYKHLHLDKKNTSAMLDTAGVKINLGGVGKGYGADIAKKIFIKYGIKDGLIDFGTSTIVVFGKKRIGLKNPRGNEMNKVIELQDATISTSGDYEKYFVIDNKRYHHIIDPKKCTPTDNGIVSVSVAVSNDVENSATIADILSTSIFILGEQQSKILLTPKNYIVVDISKEVDF